MRSPSRTSAAEHKKAKIPTPRLDKHKYDIISHVNKLNIKGHKKNLALKSKYDS